MRCPAKGGPSRVLYQVSFLLLWILHSASCRERSVTSWRPGASITTVEPTLTTGPGTSTGKPSGQEQTLTSVPPGTVSLGDVTSLPVADVAADSSTPPSDWVSPTASHGNHGNLVGQQPDVTTGSGGVDTPNWSNQLSLSPTSQVTTLSELWSLHSSPSQPPLSSLESSAELQLDGPFTTTFSFIHPSDIYSDPLLLPSSEFPHQSSPSDAPWSSLTPTPSLDVSDQLVTSHHHHTSGAVFASSDPTPSHTFLTSPTSGVANMAETSSVTSSHDVGATRVPSVPPSVLHVDINATHDGELFTDLTPTGEMWNQTSGLPSGDDKEGLSVGATVGISVACVLVVVSGVLVGLAILYHRHKSRKLDTTKVPSNHYTGLWDDNITLSYINNHFDFFQKDAQDEMISLDNDAYLNSLEFMVFTNTWGDGKRNTRF